MPTPRVAIDDLPSATTPLNGADVLIVQQGGVTKKVTSTEVALVGPAGADGAPGPPGVDGAPGMTVGDTPPIDTDVLWADTTVEGSNYEQPDTVSIFTYTDPTDPRPSSTVVWWVADPWDLDDPFAALPGDAVLHSTPDVIVGVNGITGLWQGTAAEYAAEVLDPNVVYFILPDPEP